mgnify:CR=1 FL=1
MTLCCIDPDIRHCVLKSLDYRFDQHLAQAENLASLFIALNDEMFEIRSIAMMMIGRLSQKNPAYVMPSLRKILIHVKLTNCVIIATAGSTSFPTVFGNVYLLGVWLGVWSGVWLGGHCHSYNAVIISSSCQPLTELWYLTHTIFGTVDGRTGA